MNEETKKVFSPRPMVSFKGPRKISSYLVRAKSYPFTVCNFQSIKNPVELNSLLSKFFCNIA